MKECKYCRTMYADNLLVCPNCGGNKIVTAEERAEEIALKQKEKENRENAMAEPLKMRKNILIGVGTVVGLLLLIIVITSINANKPYLDGTTKDQAAELLDTGKEYLDKGEYEAAIECFGQLPTDSKEYAEAQSMIEKAKEAYKKHIFEKVDEYVQNKEYEVALEMLKNAQTMLPEDEEIKSAYKTTHDSYTTLVRNSAIGEAEGYVKNGDYPTAIAVIHEAVALIGQDEELIAKLKVHEDSYTAAVIKSAKDQYIEYNFASIMAAEESLNAALNILPENAKLLTELNYYKEREPVKLLDLETDPNLRYDVSAYSFEDVGSIKDISGTIYESGIAPSDWFENSHPYGWSETYSFAHFSWLLDYQYTKITGVFCFNAEYKNASVEVKLTIHPSSGSEKTFIITNTSGTKNFEADLTGAQSFEIGMRQSEINGTYAYLADVYVWK